MPGEGGVKVASLRHASLPFYKFRIRKMLVGCNYWASHAGTRMWELWDEGVVREDFRQLAGTGCRLVRVFPNWRDFQPIEASAGWCGIVRGLSCKGRMLDGQSDGVDDLMVERFRTLAEIAGENGLQLVVAIVTGWMSGTLFVPPALEKLNPLADSVSIKWQVRFVRRMVRELRDCPAIAYWELGNECNCMGKVADPADAWMWTNAIASAIRLEDATRPVASGMHGLMPGEDLPGSANCWTIQTQGELCDLLTAHPYPHSPTKQAARVDPHTSIRAAFQAAFEMLYYSDVSGRPAAVEENGTLSPSYCANREKGLYLRNSLFNAWAHGAEFYLWWCAYDQAHLPFPPYEWSAWERELGLFDAGRHPKEVAAELKNFRDFLSSLPDGGRLPPHRRDAVCILTREQGFDQTMSNAWSAFLLAKQNGFDLRFQYVNERLDDAPVYIMPGVSGACAIHRSEYLELLRRVEDGATLYVSLDDGSLSPFEAVFGVEVASREARNRPARFTTECGEFEIDSPFKLNLRAIGAEVLGAEEDGNPVFIRNKYGRGAVCLLTLPVEKALAGRPGAFHSPREPEWCGLYAPFAARAAARRLVHAGNRLVTITEHPDCSSPDKCKCVVVNNSSAPITPALSIREGWMAAEGIGEIPAHSGMLLELQRIG